MNFGVRPAGKHSPLLPVENQVINHFPGDAIRTGFVGHLKSFIVELFINEMLKHQSPSRIILLGSQYEFVVFPTFAYEAAVAIKTIKGISRELTGLPVNTPHGDRFESIGRQVGMFGGKPAAVEREFELEGSSYFFAIGKLAFTSPGSQEELQHFIGQLHWRDWYFVCTAYGVGMQNNRL